MVKAIHWYDTKLREKTKIYFEKYFSSRWIKQFFGKIIENLRKHRNVKTATTTTKRRRYYLVSELNYHSTKIFTENLLVIEMTKK